MVRFQTLVEALQFWTDKRPDSPAFIFHDKEHVRRVLTWKVIHVLAGRLAAVLRARLGLRRGHLVALTLPNSPERVVCEAGILMSGAASVNGQCLLADGSDLLRTLRRSRARAVIVDPDAPNSPWDVLKRHIITPETDEDEDGVVMGVTSEELPELKYVYFVRRVQDKGPGDFFGRLETLQDWFQADDITPDDMVTVFTTSGTTGFSKMVVATNKVIVVNQDAVENVPEVLSVGINFAPQGWMGGYPGYVFLFGIVRVVCDVRSGGNPEDMPNFIWRCIQEENVTNALLFPAHLPRLAELATSSEVGSEGQDRDTVEKTDGSEDQKADNGVPKPGKRNAENNSSCVTTNTGQQKIGEDPTCTTKQCVSAATKTCADTKEEAATVTCCSPRLMYDKPNTEQQKTGEDPTCITTTCGTNGCATAATKSCAEENATAACCSPDGQTPGKRDDKTTCSTRCASKQTTENECAAAGCCSPRLMYDGNPQTDGTRSNKVLRMVFLGGLPITRSMVKASLVLADAVIVSYGSTDFNMVSSTTVTEGSFDDFVDYDNGPPVKRVEVKIVNEGDESVEMPQDQLGYIVVKSHFLDAVYFNDPQETAAAFTKDGYFRTGDVGRFDSRGHLIVEGRGSDAIMRGPYIFYPGWLEKRINACPGVQGVMVVGVPDPVIKEELCACVVFDDNHDGENGGGNGDDDDDDAKLARVREFVEKDIVAKEDDPLSPRPRYYLRFESFPTTYTDKPLRKLVKKMAAERLGLSCPTSA